MSPTIFREIRKREFYMKPSQRRRKKSELARKRAHKRRNQYPVRLDPNGDPTR